MPSQLQPTDEVISESQMRDLYNYDECVIVDDRVETHDGAWLREDGGWRWWETE